MVYKCVDYILEKKYKNDVSKINHIIKTKENQFIHLDLRGPMLSDLLLGFKYFITFINDYSYKI